MKRPKAYLAHALEQKNRDWTKSFEQMQSGRKALKNSTHFPVTMGFRFLPDGY